MTLTRQVNKGGLNWKNEISKSFESRMTSSFDEEDEGPEIIDLQPTLAQQNSKHVSGKLSTVCFNDLSKLNLPMGVRF